MSAIGLSLALVRADRLLWMVLLLQARGGTTARAWFGGQQEEAPCLRELAQALRLGRKLAVEYRSAGARDGEHRDGGPRVVGPLGLVNKAGTWYLVATPGPGDIRVFRAGRVLSARVLPEAFGRPADFELAGFWAQWSAEFEASRPRLQVRLNASPQALGAFPEVFGPAGGAALEAAAPPGEDGWRVVTLSFEHERAAVHRLAGFGAQVAVLDPPSVRARLLATAREILGRYDAAR